MSANQFRAFLAVILLVLIACVVWATWHQNKYLMADRGFVLNQQTGTVCILGFDTTPTVCSKHP